MFDVLGLLLTSFICEDLLPQAALSAIIPSHSITGGKTTPEGWKNHDTNCCIVFHLMHTVDAEWTGAHSSIGAESKANQEL